MSSVSSPTCTSQQGLPVDQSNTLNTIEELYEGEVKDYVIARLIKEFLTIKNKLDPRSKESTLNRVTTPRFRDSILRYYHLEKEIAKDFSQAEITAMNGTISQFSRVLENTADTLIYVDYWASWCRPCIQEFSFSRQLKKKMNGKKIKFVYLSIDAQQNDWLAVAKNFDFMKEDNSFLIKNQKLSPLTRLLSVDAIPRYVLIKEDNIIHPKALRPSDPNIENFLEQYISQ